MGRLPIIKDRDLLRALKKFGFVEARQQGSSHLILKHPDGRMVSLPIHAGRDLPRGTLSGMLRSAGITVDQLIDAL